MTFHLEILARSGLYTHTVIILKLKKTLGGGVHIHLLLSVGQNISRAFTTHRLLPLYLVQWSDPQATKFSLLNLYLASNFHPETVLYPFH